VFAILGPRALREKSPELWALKFDPFFRSLNFANIILRCPAPRIGDFDALALTQIDQELRLRWVLHLWYLFIFLRRQVHGFLKIAVSSRRKRTKLTESEQLSTSSDICRALHQQTPRKMDAARWLQTGSRYTLQGTYTRTVGLVSLLAIVKNIYNIPQTKASARVLPIAETHG